jgi:Xaa-Pro aminopeptidase
MSAPRSAQRLTPVWNYRPGPDVSLEPPPGLRAAQALANAGLKHVEPGVTERAVELAVSSHMVANGARGIWTITNVGLGANARICFPTHPPTDLSAAECDILMVDVHPITADGSWGDCTRCRVVGDFAEASRALSDLEALHYEMLSRCRPGMPANELFGMVHERLTVEGFVLLDLLANIGHSLTAGAAYLHGFIDAGNITPMWGAWAIEPFAARGDVAVKVEDLVWFGREHCEVL